ncbi:hypothetical protein HN51_064223 [Arachis hypogaea]|uniref:uncharacterized protein LOC107620394 isoform X1 n=1 Tax=Arachis ipaensis TaxID=130454 RepID=UPI0007AFCA25|nr:uncharacterized protein LOC107620394 isoform X1 [Arachis ipaensis]XP_025630667.1 uncharacterized protein LOC112723492 [Arachis hypogaea]QHO21834.1 uncharacterized protein DS421_11g350090 [Arachis hypogaea]
MQRRIVEKSGQVMRLRVRKKRKSGSGRKAAVLKKLATYLQCDTFMYAPLVSDFPDPALPLFPSPAKVVELKKPRKEKQRFVDQLVEYLKSDVYMYAPLLRSSSGSGTSQQSPTKFTSGNVNPQTDLSQQHHASVQNETIKHTLYQMRRSVSASRNVSVKSQLRTHS